MLGPPSSPFDRRIRRRRMTLPQTRASLSRSPNLSFATPDDDAHCGLSHQRRRTQPSKGSRVVDVAGPIEGGTVSRPLHGLGPVLGTVHAPKSTQDAPVFVLGAGPKSLR